MNKRLLSLLVVSVLALTTLFAQEKPLLTVACISDIHTERALIDQANLDDIKLRGSFVQTLQRIRQEENIDLMLLGGDCTSDVTITQRNWERVRQLIAEATRGAFPDDKPTPVLYVTGNHDYEVANFDHLPKPYNAADYYTFPMREDVGVLDFEDAFYEKADNGSLGQMPLLAAYHYVVNGFDFIILNCGKRFFASAWDYVYSEESVQWVADKLEQIYAAQPGKTVFFALHVPFSDSNSLSAPGKGIASSPGEKLLKQTLSKYPNLVMLYGHDHGRNTAYTRRKTSQRVTHYDIEGNVIATTDENHHDGATQDPENDDNIFYLKNAATGQHLGIDSYNLTAMASRTALTFTPRNGGGFYVEIAVPNSQDSKFIHIGGSGRYSSGTPSTLFAYEVTDDADGIRATRVDHPAGQRKYVLVALYNNAWYALRGELYSAGSDGQRLVGTPVQLSADQLTLTTSTTDNALEWQFQSLLNGTDMTHSQWYVQSLQNQRYLGFNEINLATVDYPNIVTIDLLNELTAQVSVSVAGSSSEANGNYIVSSTSGRFSGNSTVQPTWLYRVEKTADGKITARKTASVKSGDQIIIVAQNMKNNSELYALTNQEYTSGSSCRLEGLRVYDADGVVTIDADRTDAVWTFTEVRSAEPSFFSAFMGSMRYYYNTIDPGDMPTETPNIVQALMVYVYADRVELHMKNYNRYGSINNITVNRQLAPYIAYRKVEVKELAVDLNARLKAAIAAAEAFAQPTTDVLQNALDEAVANARNLLDSSDDDAVKAALEALSRALNDARLVDVSLLRSTYNICLEEGIEGTYMEEAGRALREATDMQPVNAVVGLLQVNRKVANSERHDYPFTSVEPKHGLNFYLYNVGQHRFFCGGARWGTHAALGWPGIQLTLRTVSASQGSFAINTHLNDGGNAQWLDAEGYCDHDASSYGWIFKKLDNGNYVVSAASSGLMLGFSPYTLLGGAYYYDHVALLADGDPDNPDNQWMLVTREQRNALLADATPESPVDASQFIKMPNFSQREYNEVAGGWDGPNGAWQHNSVGDAGNITISERGDNRADFAFQCWNANPLLLTQTVTGLPAGRYRLTLTGFYREGGKENHAEILQNGQTPVQAAKVYINDNEMVALPGIHEAADRVPGIGWQGPVGQWADQSIDAVEYFENNLYFVETPEFEVGDDGQFTIAVKKDYEKPYDWVLVDNFRLVCVESNAPSAIVQPRVNAFDPVVYDLQGRRVNTQDARGPVIVDGKKMIKSDRR